MASIGDDLRLAFRSLSRTPGFSAIAIVAFALGIGANSAIFSVVNALLLRPMSYADPERLVVAEHQGPSPVAPATFLDWKQQATTFTDMAAAQAWSGALRATGTPESLIGLRVTANMFSLLGVAAVRGRTFVADEGRDGAAPVVVISHSLWQRSFGGASDIVGRHIMIDDTSYSVVGVMPPSFQFAPFWVTKAEIWTPFVFGDRRTDRIGKSLRVFARLKPGKSIEEAQAEMGAIMNRLARQYPDSSAKESVSVVSLSERVVGNVRPMLLVLLGTVSFVLLIACANVANLMLARASGRRREVAVRIALGATRWRLATRSIAESAILALVGGTAGLLLAWILIRAVRAVVPAATLPRQGEIGLDAQVILFTATLSLVTGLLASVLPAWHAAKGDVNDALKEGGRSGSSGARAHFTRTALVVAETALAFVLLIGAGLMVRSFARLLTLDPGFDPKNLITAEISVAGTTQAYTGRRLTFYREVLERLAAVPGVRAASVVNHAPITGDVWGTRFRIEDRPEPLPGEFPNAVYRVAFPGYFQTMRTPMLRGKDFDNRDNLDSPFVVIVNQSLAGKHWPGEDAVGKRIIAGTGGRLLSHTIVGVVQDLKQSDWQANPREEIYFPLLQSVEYLSGDAAHNQFLSLVIRVDSDPAGKIASIRRTIAAVDPNVLVRNAVTMESAVAQNTWRPRLSLFLLGTFGLVAVVLAITGIYGVISYAVSQRTHEIGIRVALGAARGSVLLQSIVRSLGPLCAGLAIGGLMAASLTRLMQAMLFGVQPTDGVTFGTAAVLMFAAGLFASFWPALRAARVDPVIALRHD